jgi:chloride channel 3/4/5
MMLFILIGMGGGVIGALFIKASRFWALVFRRLPIVHRNPFFETLAVGCITGLCSFWNKYTRFSDNELLSEITAACAHSGTSLADFGPCPAVESIPDLLKSLTIAFLVKGALTIITFGLKVPAGIYIPSMVVGGLFGKIVGHALELSIATFPRASFFSECNKAKGVGCVTPGVYAMVGAGATMCGVTRLPITLAVILFEITGSLDYMIPSSVAIIVSKWVADALESSGIYVG